MSAVRCPRKACGELMRDELDSLGRVVFVCGGCERNRRGICRACPKPLASRRCMRCEGCGRARRLEKDRLRDRERYPERRATVLAHHVAKNRDPEWRSYRSQYMRAYRAQHPRDACDRAYGRVYMASRRADPTYRDRINARKRELRALKKQRAQQECAA